MIAVATLAAVLLISARRGRDRLLLFPLGVPAIAIRVEINDPDIEDVLTKTGARIKTTDKQGEMVVSPGEHKPKIRRGDLEMETDQFIVKKGDAVTVKVEWLAGKLAVAKTDGTVARLEDGRSATTPQVAKADAAWTPDASSRRSSTRWPHCLSRTGSRP